MITKLIKKIGKRRYTYKTYELNELNNYVKPTLSSPLLGEGNVSIKTIVSNHQVNQYITLPNSIHYPLKRVENEQMLPKMNTFQVEMDCNNFFTLNLFSKRTLQDVINDVKQLTGENEYLVVNMVIKKIPKQINKFLSQYEQFTKGVEVPSSNSIVSTIQRLCIDKESGVNYIPIEIIKLIENKIVDQHYQFQLFIGMKYESKEKEELVKGVLQDTLDEYSHLNSLILEGVSYDENTLSTDELLYQYSKHYISLSEICSLLYKTDVELITAEDMEQSEDTTANGNTDTNDIEITTPITQPILQPTSTNALDTLPSLELLPVQIETNEDDVDMKIPERIQNALKRVRIVDDVKKIKVLDFHVGASLIRTTIEIPKDKNFSDIQKKTKDIQVALGVETLAVDQGDVPDSVSFFIPRVNKQPIYLRTLLENDEFIKFAENYPLPFIVGVDPLGKPIYQCLNKLTHILVSGQTDSGKTAWMNQLILTLIMLRTSKELMLYLIDPKQVEFTPFKEFPQVAEVLDDMNKANKLLERLVVEMEKRYTIMKESGVRNIKGYNQKFPDKKLPYIVTVLDEYADLKTVNPTVDEHLARLGQKARASGIHLIVATQRPSVDVIEGKTKANLPSKISLKLDSVASYKTILDGKPPVEPTGKGHGVMKLLGQAKEYEQFQGAIISIDELETEDVFDKIKKSFKGEKVEGIKIEKNDEKIEGEEKEEPIIKMKRVIAQTGEVRVGELRKLMEMNTNVVTDLMQQLADDGWLNRPDEVNRKWSLNDECEELMKLRQLYGYKGDE